MLSCQSADPDEGDQVEAERYAWALNPEGPWTEVGVDETPADPLEWNSGMNESEVWLRAASFDGDTWGEWCLGIGSFEIDNTPPAIGAFLASAVFAEIGDVLTFSAVISDSSAGVNESACFALLTHDQDEFAAIPLVDTGDAGDELAGDGTFTAQWVAGSVPPATYAILVEAENTVGHRIRTDPLGELVLVECLADGDVNDDGVLTLDDADCALSMFLNGSDTLPPCAETRCASVAADVDGDGNCSPGDARLISLECSDPGAYLPNPPINVAALRGALPARAAPGEHVLTVSPATIGEIPGTISTSLRLTNFDDLAAFGVKIGFDQTQLVYLGTEPGAGLAGNFVVEAQKLDAGELIVGGYQSTGSKISPSGSELLKLIFRGQGLVHDQVIWVEELYDDLENAHALLGRGDSGALSWSSGIAGATPNPFKQSTAIRLQIASGDAGQHMQVSVVDLTGRQVRSLATSAALPGRFVLIWDGRDDQGLAAPTGMYLCRLRLASEEHVRRLLLVR